MRFVLFVFVLVVAAFCDGVKQNHADLFTMQPSGCIMGSSISYDTTDSIWQVKDNAGQIATAKGIMVHDTSDTGSIVVHLINNSDSSGADVWTTFYLEAEDNLGIIFDKVKQTGTTIATGGLYIWLCEAIR